MKYYFLVASLPSLALGKEPALSPESFRALCREHLAAGDAQGLEELDAAFERKPRHPFVREWVATETRLRNAVAGCRAARRGRDAGPYVREQATVDLYTAASVEEAFARANPLEREMMLDRIRWRQLEELSGFDPFDGRAVLAYAVKLRLAARWAAMNEEQGRMKAEALVARGPRGEAQGAEVKAA